MSKLSIGRATLGRLPKYLEFLKSGASDYSINILKKAGVDLTTDEPYNVMNEELEWAIKELSKLIEDK